MTFRVCRRCADCHCRAGSAAAGGGAPEYPRQVPGRSDATRRGGRLRHLPREARGRRRAQRLRHRLRRRHARHHAAAARQLSRSTSSSRRRSCPTASPSSCPIRRAVSSSSNAQNQRWSSTWPTSPRRRPRPLPPPQNRMTFFVTSDRRRPGRPPRRPRGRRPSLPDLAKAAGAGDRTWRAYLSTSFQGKPAVNAGDRIGSGPWYNAAGVLVARGPVDLHTKERFRPDARPHRERASSAPPAAPCVSPARCPTATRCGRQDLRQLDERDRGRGAGGRSGRRLELRACDQLRPQPPTAATAPPLLFRGEVAQPSLKETRWRKARLGVDRARCAAAGRRAARGANDRQRVGHDQGQLRRHRARRVGHGRERRDQGQPHRHERRRRAPIRSRCCRRAATACAPSCRASAPRSATSRSSVSQNARFDFAMSLGTHRGSRHGAGAPRRSSTPATPPWARSSIRRRSSSCR